MAKKQNRYKEMERYLTYALFACLVFFFSYLLFAALGVVWIKVILSILAILTSLLCLGWLFLTQELLRRRSLWLTASFAAVLLCVLVSLLCNYPSPQPEITLPALGSILLP